MKAKDKQAEPLVILAPNLQTMDIPIVGTAPLVQHRFSKKVLNDMLGKHIAGSTAKSKNKKTARDVEQDFIDATHLTEDGQYGIPAPAFRSAMISACRLIGFQMTKAKLSVFVLADDLDAEDGSPLVLLDKSSGAPELHKSAVRLATGVASVAIRPMWRKWSATVRVRWDADQFTQNDVINLLARAGMQVGIGEGRPDSKKSNGMGWGTFEIVTGEIGNERIDQIAV